MTNHPKHERNINVDNGNYREVQNQGIYTEGDINIALQSIDSSARSRTEKILLSQVGAEIASRLRQSLHNQVFINLEKEEQPKQVRRPWDYEIKLRFKTQAKLSSDTTILQVFDRDDIQGRLLILGKPGSGKTTTMLDLAKKLLERAKNPNNSIPVLLNLASWASKQQSISEWIAEELKTKYGLQTKVSQKWLQEQKILPLLDGLDEVKSEQQQTCIEAINFWISGNTDDSCPGYFVICSRIEEYEKTEARLQMNGAVCLRALTNRQIKDYLESVGHSRLWSIANKNQKIRGLICAPLFLSMLAITADAASKELQSIKEAEDAEFCLVDIYTKEMLHRTKSYTPQKMRLWLAWLAQNMEAKKQTELLVEKIQPSWLSVGDMHSEYIWNLTWIPGAPIALCFGLIGLLVGLEENWYVSIIAFLGSALYGFYLSSLLIVFLPIWERRIKLFEYLSLSWVELICWILIGLSSGFLVGLIGALSTSLNGLLSSILSGVVGGGVIAGLLVTLIGLRFGWELISTLLGIQLGILLGLVSSLTSGVLTVGNSFNSGVWFSFWLGIGFIFSLFLWLKFRLIGNEIDEKVFTNQGIWKSLKTGLFTTLIFSVIFSLVFGLVFGISILLFICALAFGLLAGLFSGLSSCIQHFILRWTLYHCGFAPWNYDHFLDSATDCLLLQRVGGRFRFMHKTIQEHFSGIELA